MTADKWLRISIPIQGFLLLWQLGTGLNVDRITNSFSDLTYRIVHIGGGSLLILLVIIHLAINWGWVRKTYGRKAPLDKGTP